MKKCPYTIEQIYSDNGWEYRGNPGHHAFMRLSNALPKLNILIP